MPIRILVVDDAAFIRDMMKKHLRGRIKGAELYDAVDGNRAVAMLKANHIDLIMSDWEMPGMTGEDLLRWVRQDEAYRQTPFVMVSSRGDRDHIVKAIEAGVSDYLTKPFTPEELVKKAAKQLTKIGMDPNIELGAAGSQNQSHGFGSIEALTGGKAETISNAGINNSTSKNNTSKISSPNTAKSNVTKPNAIKPNAIKPSVKGAGEGLLSATKATPKLSPGKGGDSNKPKAQLRFPNCTYACEVKDLSLQALVGIISRGENVPTAFDPAVVDIATQDDQNLARINGFVHGVQVNGNSVNADTLKITVRFVDDDPQKFETLSKFIAKK